MLYIVIGRLEVKWKRDQSSDKQLKFELMETITPPERRTIFRSQTDLKTLLRSVFRFVGHKAESRWTRGVEQRAGV